MLTAIKRLGDRPFATALGTLLVMSSIITLTGVSQTADALQSLVPDWLLLGLSVAYGTGGALILLGMLLRKNNLEAAGCVLVGNGLLIRMVALLYALGFGPSTVATSAFYMVFGWACWERFRQVIAGDNIIRVHREIQVIFEGDSDDDSS